jgi:PhnB protein
MIFAMANVKAIPDGFHSLTAYLMMNGAAEAIEFYKNAFGATETSRFTMPDGRIGHADIVIGDSHIMLADEFPEMNYLGPKARGGATAGIMIYTEDADAMFKRAIAHGGKELKPMSDQFYGDRTGTLEDPFGHWWTISQHIEDVSDEEMERRHAEFKPPEN